MRQTWRWFGTHDRVSIADIRQAGAEGIVTALHHVPTGEIWTRAEIERRKSEIADAENVGSLGWEVVESLPVSEDIKLQTGAWRHHMENYKTSLRNLAAAGIKTVCYNFMPVLDWTRTDLAYRLPTGARCMRFDVVDFAAFDLFVLKRQGAGDDYSSEILAKAERRNAELSDTARKALVDNIVCGLPGAAESFDLNDIRQCLENYADVDETALRGNFTAFLEEVAPVAQSLGLRLCCHPDDPPIPLLGLPRIMSTERQLRKILDAVDLPANGLTFCTGSLAARPDNDLPAMIGRLGSRIHFLHLRDVVRESYDIGGSFHESEHLGGNTDMIAVAQAVLCEERRRKQNGRDDASIPFRPDHGIDILDDLTRNAQPGYPAIGRLKGLAELRGVITALEAVGPQ